MKTVVAALLASLLLCASKIAAAQTPSAWHDELVEHMAGTWNLEGTLAGKEAHHTVTAEWVLNHQFLQLHETTSASAPAPENRYDALWFIGYDDVSERYVVHLLDIFGTRYSETLGYGTRNGNSIALVFEYPDGPFHTTYRWIPEDGSWRWLLEQKDKNGKWTTSADFKHTRPANR
ncbi:MAG: DUF1579 family protein [Candidatus Acidiferrales bacterium]|jgi:hypothetical protein